MQLNVQLLELHLCGCGYVTDFDVADICKVIALSSSAIMCWQRRARAAASSLLHPQSIVIAVCRVCCGCRLLICVHVDEWATKA
jgi:hypothetical protein